MDSLSKILLSGKGWNIKPPKLIISVLGSSTLQYLTNNSRKKFYAGLLNAAKTAGKHHFIFIIIKIKA